MPIHSVDTNVLIRYMTQDDADKSERARRLIVRVERGEEHITVCEAVITEVVHILSSKRLYNVVRTDIRRHLEAFLKLRGLKVPKRSLYVRALELYATSVIDFVDALIIAHAEHSPSRQIYSFDRHFDGFPFMTRTEP